LKAAIIAPVALLEKYAYTDYHLTLVDLLLNEPAYYDFYRSRSFAGDFVIIDNSAHEFGTSQHEETMIDLAKQLHAHEVVLPERMFWGKDTIEMAKEIYPLYREKLPHTKIAGVPQGRTIEEWDWCCLQHLKMGVDTIGISKDFEVWPGGLAARLVTVRMLCRQAQRAFVEVHMLGWGRNLCELHEIASIAEHRIAPVRGVDSAKPLVFAAADITLPIDFWACGNLPEYPRRPSNFFDLNDTEINEEAAHTNILSFLAQTKPHSSVSDAN
jgi:hypothetical protein